MQQEGGLKKYLSLGIGLLVLIIGAASFLFLKRPSDTGGPEPGASGAPTIVTDSDTKEDVPDNVVVPDVGDQVAGNIAVPESVSPAAGDSQIERRNFGEVEVSGNRFDPDTIVIHKGDIVKIYFTAIDKDYDLVQPDYGIELLLPKGVKKLLPFQAVSEGKFTFYCGKCGGPSQGPVGYIIVVPK